MDKKNISIIHEELIEDFYSLAQIHYTEIKKLLEEFEDDQMQFTIELETYEKERTQAEDEHLEGSDKDQINLSDVSVGIKGQLFSNCILKCEHILKLGFEYIYKPKGLQMS